MKCPLLHGNIQKETDKETKKVGFVTPAVQNNSLNNSA